MHDIIVGIDPASQHVGLAVISLRDASPLLARTLTVRGALFPRLVQLTERLTTWFPQLTADGYAICGFGIENPAQGLGRHGQNRHDTAFVLGRSFHAVQVACSTYAHQIDRVIPMVEVLPRESSEAVGCSPYATKLERNTQCCRIAGGEYRVTNPRTNDGYCDGGVLHQSNPDALDAFAAACAAWGKLRAQAQESSRRDTTSSIQSRDGSRSRKRRSARAD